MFRKKKMKKDFLLGVFEEEDQVLATTKKLHQNGVPIEDVYTPYPVHGLDGAMGIKRTRLPVVTFVMGFLGAFLALSFQIWVFTRGWPINIGGKPFLSLPAFIPITFELMVLIAGLSTVAAFFIRQKFYPGLKPNLFDLGITDNRFVIALEKSAAIDYAKVSHFLKEQGAIEVRESVSV